MRTKKIIAMITLVCVVMGVSINLTACNKKDWSDEKIMEDYAKNATIVQEINSSGANNLIKDNSKVWKVKDNGSVTFDLGEVKLINTLAIQEKTDNVELFKIYISQDNENYDMIYQQDRIDDYRICAFEDVMARYVKLEITKQLNTTKIKDVQIGYVAKKNQEFRVNGYLSYNEDTLIEKENDVGFSGYFDVLTDVILIGNIQIDSNAEVLFANGEEKFAEGLAALRRTIGERQVNIWACVFFRMTEDYSDHDGIAEFINEHIDKITTNIATFAQKYDLYGIDFDWEYPTKSRQWRAYDLIINETYYKLNAMGKKISLALPPWGVKLSKESINNIYWANIMCYDFFDERGDHASIYYAGAGALDYMASRGFPKEKVLLGPPFYGRKGKDSTFDWPNHSSFYDKETNTNSLGKFDNFAERDKVDEQGQVIGKERAYLDGYSEIRDKTATAIALGYRGIMVFAVNCDSPYYYEYSLHRAVKEIVDQRA